MSVTSRMIEFLTEEARKTRSPFTVNFELLPYCNLSCKMCYIKTSKADVNRQGGLIPKEKWLELGEQIKEAGALLLLLTGGEAMLRPDFKEIYKGLYDMGFLITVNTNASLIDEAMADFLRTYPPKCVSISLYGASEETYQKLCGDGKVYNRVMHAIDLLQERHLKIECKTILTPLNAHDLAACVAFTKERGIPYESTPYAFPATRKEKQDEEQIRFSPSQACDMTFVRNRLTCTDEEYYKDIEDHYKKYLETKSIEGCQQTGLSCTGSNTACWITWQGKMRPCALMNYPETYPFEDGFLNSWQQLKEKTDRIIQSPKCSMCDKREVCTVCPASNYAETGTFEKASPFHCEMTELTLKRIEAELKAKGEE